jgi:hypothetical protein
VPLGTLKRPMRNPILFGSDADRTGGAGIVRRAEAVVGVRFASLRKQVLEVFDAIPRYALNAAEVVYGLTADQYAALSADLQDAVQRWLLTGEGEYKFWYERYSVESTYMGTVQSQVNLSALSEVYAAARPIEAIIYSAPYQLRLATAKFSAYEHWTGLATTQKTQLAEIIGRAIVDGKNPRDVRDEIRQSLDVTESKARQYAQTDITDTLRKAKIAETEATEAELGLKTGLLWSSALKPTTRPWHAARNGQVYTPEQVKTFYTQRGNRYGCLCGITECLLDSEGRPILTGALKKRMGDALEKWQKASP